MTTVTLNNEAANTFELSSTELDQVIGGRNGGGIDHNGAIGVAMQIAGAVGVVGIMIAGLIGAFVRGE